MLLVLSLTVGYLPVMTNAAAVSSTVVTDPGTAHTWEEIMDTDGWTSLFIKTAILRS